MKEFFEMLVSNLPAIITALAALVTAIGATRQSRRNGGEVQKLHTKTEELQQTTQGLAVQGERILVQTNGHLKELEDQNQNLQETLRITMSILAAREGKVPSIRREDLPELPDALRLEINSVIDHVVERRVKT